MAVDSWFKVRTKLPRDGRLREASIECHGDGVTNVAVTGTTLVTLMFGALAILWSLADEHADDDGVLRGYTAAAVNEYVGVQRFCESLPAEWIDLSGKWVKLPQYQEHNGSTGKTRAQATKRKRHERSATDDGQTSRSNRDAGVTRVEKSREEELGNSPTSVETEEEARNKLARASVLACIALRKLGMSVQPAMPKLLELVAAGATIEQMCLTASELALREAGMLNDTELHPELLELFASGASPELLMLTVDQLNHLKNSAPNINYLAATLAGRAKDAARESNGDTHATGRTAGHTAHRSGESASARAERAAREGEAREAAHGFAAES